MADALTLLNGKKYGLLKAGNLQMLQAIIKIARAIAPGENELYPAWQGIQLMHSMSDGRRQMSCLDNNRYPQIDWLTVKEILAESSLFRPSK